jgi:signal peptidase II
MPYYYVTLVLCAVDQLVKWLVQTKLVPFQTLGGLDGWISITYVQNRGAAFGMFESQTLFLIAVAGGVFLFTWMHRREIYKYPKFFQLGLAITLGGAFGNFIDRIRLGYVVDYLDINFWPVFNFADINIVLGVGLIVLTILSENLQQKKHSQHIINGRDAENSRLAEEDQA